MVCSVSCRGVVALFLILTATPCLWSDEPKDGPLPAAEPHSWLPPFGLDRVGTRADLPFEADAVACADQPVNPVDLGAIFVPHGWLLLGPKMAATVEVAAVSHSAEVAGAKVSAWLKSRPKDVTRASFDLPIHTKVTHKLALGRLKGGAAKDVLCVSISDASGGELWRKDISVMFVKEPPELPRFGAVEMKLRYDLPITVNRGEGGKLGELSTIEYEKGWDAKFNDVVVCLPNGSRFVFWRGSSYIPFWAGRNNTGTCYEWAEWGPPADGFVDSVEPLMDKELRYGRVEVVESTPARVHVRWTYQSTDFQYKVWGDQAVEDFYFYPDGFGTRVLNIRRDPSTDYELSEFIVLSPPGAYPFDFLPRNAVEMVYLDGERGELHFPPDADGPHRSFDPAFHRRPTQVVYRVRAHKDDASSAIYFHTDPTHYPAIQFAPFSDKGRVVTPAYWGSHWPLSRGKSTGASIDDRVTLSPAHNSLVSWARNRPAPYSREQLQTIDTLGRSKEMVVERWAWLIGMTDADDGRLRQWGQSFTHPPALKAEGATLDLEAYAISRRAIRLNVVEKTVSIQLTPSPVTVNPVFELLSTPGSLRRIRLDGRDLPKDRHAWDGRTLWVDATLSDVSALELEFK